MQLIAHGIERGQPYRQQRRLTQGQPMPASPVALVAQGVARIPEDRHSTGVVGDLPVWENAVSERLRSRWFSRLGWVRRAAARRQAQHVSAQFDVRGHH